MMTIAAILWLISGVVSFFTALKRIWTVINDVFIVGENILKYATLVGLFIFHLVGGVISLGLTVYKYFQGE